MNLPLVPVFASLLRIPYGLIYPAILIVCIIGAFAVASGLFEVGLMLVFAVCGYFMKKGGVPAAPMLMALLMGPMMERNLYQALNLAHGNMLVFVQRPISATLLGIIVRDVHLRRHQEPPREEGRRRGGGGVASSLFDLKPKAPGAAGRRPGPFPFLDHRRYHRRDTCRNRGS